MAATPSPEYELPHNVLALFAGSWSGARVEGLGGAGGFSGAKFWRVHVSAGRYCLRRWPREHPSPERLALQHAVLAHAQSRGINFVPVPIRSVQSESDCPTVISNAGHLWELTPWMSGEADFFPNRDTARLAAAAKALAGFHEATSDFPRQQYRGIAPSAQQRLQLLDQFAELSPKIAAAIGPSMSESELGTIAGDILNGFAVMQPIIRRELTQVCSVQARLQPAIRDVWSDHILFEGHTVTGIVDFGALRIDSIAVDIARLLGSLAGDDEHLWRAGLEAYQSVRRLDASEVRLVGIFDRASVVLAGLNWLRWMFVDGRRFEDLPAVVARLRVTRDRLRHLIHRPEQMLL